MRIAVTGGAGYIGSHTVTLLLEAGHEVLILDSFANAANDVPDRLAEIAGRAAEVVCADITQSETYRAALEAFRPQALIHFAGLKAVSEAIEHPLEYYRVNVAGSVTLFQVMAEIGCNRLVFSSSATVYGNPDYVPITEDHPCRPTNPYGRSKRMVEEVIQDWVQTDPSASAVILRYFNPVGAHPSARIGEAPEGVPNNLVPYIAQVAQGVRKRLTIFGDDYDTPDGTGVRDYIHVMDLAAAHLTAIDRTRVPGVTVLNLGTGQGYSVLEVIRAFEAASGRPVPNVVMDRRPGDIATSLANPSAAAACLDWRATRGLSEMCRDTWAWQRRQKW